MQPGSFWATSYPFYDVALVGTNQRTLGPLGRDAKYTHRPVKAVLRQAAQSTLARKNATRATGKNGSCEIRIEK